MKLYTILLNIICIFFYLSLESTRHGSIPEDEDLQQKVTRLLNICHWRNPYQSQELFRNYILAEGKISITDTSEKIYPNDLEEKTTTYDFSYSNRFTPDDTYYFIVTEYFQKHCPQPYKYRRMILQQDSGHQIKIVNIDKTAEHIPSEYRMLLCNFTLHIAKYENEKTTLLRSICLPEESDPAHHTFNPTKALMSTNFLEKIGFKKIVHDEYDNSYYHILAVDPAYWVEC